MENGYCHRLQPCVAATRHTRETANEFLSLNPSRAPEHYVKCYAPFASYAEPPTVVTVRRPRNSDRHREPQDVGAFLFRSE